MSQTGAKLIGRTGKLAAGALLALVILVLYLRIFAGHVQQRAPSPDGRVIAEVRLYHGLSAMDAPEDSVQLKTRLNPFRHTVFFALNYGGDVRVSWTAPSSLVVTCSRCGELSIYAQEYRWGDVSIRYRKE